jgi:hypothetical protein
MIRTPWKSSLVFLSLFLVSPAFGEDRGVAAALGLQAASVAEAVESGASQRWNQFERDRDPTIQKMNAETSLFLRNAPQVRPVEPKAEPRTDNPAFRVKTEAEQERDLALQQLEFRRNVEDAMKRILSFSPSVRRADEPVPQPELAPAREPEFPPAPLSARERLLQSVAAGGERLPEADYPQAPEQAYERPERVEIDTRVVGPARFEASPDDDIGKPVRLGLSGNGGGQDSPVISMRRNSRKENPGEVPTIPALREKVSGAPIGLVLVPGLPGGHQKR